MPNCQALCLSVVRLADHQRFFKKQVFDFGSMSVYDFLDFHTPPQSALHFRASIVHSNCAPAASTMGEGATNYYVLVGICFSQQAILQACAMER